jgi:ATP-binding cassette, subfamily B, bacterial MsbA
MTLSPKKTAPLPSAPAHLPESAKVRMKLLGRFVQEFVRPHLNLMLGAGAAMLLFAGTVAALPWLFENLVDEVFVKRVPGTLGWLIGFVVALFSLRAVASFLQQYLLARVANRMATAVQSRFADHVLMLDLGFFHRNSIGQIVARGTEDVNVLNQSMTNLLVISVRDLLSLLGLIGYVLYASPQWFALTLLAAPLIAVPTVLATRKIRRLARQGQELNGDLIGAFEECFHAIRGIKAEANEPVEQKRLGHTIRIRRNVRFKIARTQAMLTPVVDLVTALALVAVLIVGGGSVIAGTTEPGKLMAFIGALMLLYDPLKRLLQMNALLQTCMAAISRIYDVLDQKPALSETAGSATLANPAGDIRFEEVSFGYEADAPLLKGVSLTIPAGKLVALVGASGSGKTTLINLLARLNTPHSGCVTIGGQDIADVKPALLRSQLALVAQDALLFDSTVEANIAYGMPNVGIEQIRAAAVLAEADSFISTLAEGYGFRVGPRGSRLSGGQRQRIVIARALLRNAPILMLDEATSALDGETERRVMRNIARERRGRTTLMIAHRLSTVKEADSIGFIENGALVEWGNHTALLQQNGPYARAVALQGG